MLLFWCCLVSASTINYDSFNRLTCIVYNSGDYTAYTYDASGNLLNTTNATKPANGAYPAACAGSGGAPTFPSVTLVGKGTTGNLFSLAVVALGNPPPTLVLGAGSQLPPGVTFDLATGTFKGTPTAAGAYKGTVVATNSAGSATVSYTITVAADIPTLSEWAALILLSVLLGIGGWTLRRRELR